MQAPPLRVALLCAAQQDTELHARLAVAAVAELMQADHFRLRFLRAPDLWTRLLH